MKTMAATSSSGAACAMAISIFCMVLSRKPLSFSPQASREREARKHVAQPLVGDEQEQEPASEAHDRAIHDDRAVAGHEDEASETKLFGGLREFSSAAAQNPSDPGEHPQHEQIDHRRRCREDAGPQEELAVARFARGRHDFGQCADGMRW